MLGFSRDFPSFFHKTISKVFRKDECGNKFQNKKAGIIIVEKINRNFSMSACFCIILFSSGVKYNLERVLFVVPFSVPTKNNMTFYRKTCRVFQSSCQGATYVIFSHFIFESNSLVPFARRSIVENLFLACFSQCFLMF